MATQPSDWIQDGYVTTYGADGTPNSVTHLNPQTLATDESRDKVIEYCTQNVPEGNPWTFVDTHAMSTGNNTTYNCPQWQVVAANQQMFNAGLLYYDLFYYPVPTEASVTELHKRAAM